MQICRDLKVAPYPGSSEKEGRLQPTAHNWERLEMTLSICEGLYTC